MIGTELPSLCSVPEDSTEQPPGGHSLQSARMERPEIDPCYKMWRDVFHIITFQR